MKNIAFLGLGVMGYPMAGHLSKARYEVIVYNRTQSKTKSWLNEYSGKNAEQPSDAANNADVIILCAGKDEDVDEIISSNYGVLKSIKPNTIVIDHTTTSATLAKQMASKFEKLNCFYLDAPVSGGQTGAETGQLTIMVGGDEAIFENASPIMQVYAKKLSYLGKSGNGQLAKMVNQICLAGIIQGLAEGIHFAELAELDVNTVIEVISKGAAQSWQMDNRYQTMLKREFNHGFAVEWMRKDLGYALTQAKQINASLPVTALVDQFYADIENNGGKRWDTSSLITRLK